MHKMRLLGTIEDVEKKIFEAQKSLEVSKKMATQEAADAECTKAQNQALLLRIKELESKFQPKKIEQQQPALITHTGYSSGSSNLEVLIDEHGVYEFGYTLPSDEFALVARCKRPSSETEWKALVVNIQQSGLTQKQKKEMLEFIPKNIQTHWSSFIP